MSTASITINRQAQWHIQRVGLDKTPVIIIDDFTEQTDTLINEACLRNDFSKQVNTYYPGLRSQLPRAYVIDVIQAVYQKICALYNVPLQLKLTPQETYFSLITLREDELDLVQRMPHFDTNRPFYFAILHYLNEGEHGNTGLFRHNPTHFEKIEQHNTEQYLTAAQAFIDAHGEPPQSYVTQSDAHFELYHQIAYKANRLVIYPGHLLHSILIRPELDIDADPTTGRLTANIFIEFT